MDADRPSIMMKKLKTRTHKNVFVDKSGVLEFNKKSNLETTAYSVLVVQEPPELSGRRLILFFYGIYMKQTSLRRAGPLPVRTPNSQKSPVRRRSLRKE
ncbi:hypothetical protein EVAR_36449_1 [Eumeta japonica]|uniref:Uncharacterized protein n=1 Tax=Eumeta variegata TaxID=151549 RepID=A0A4C1VPX4_EUMVA|nr:hypothetical protein EVAR_36449_1 [Eumeta japonica]